MSILKFYSVKNFGIDSELGPKDIVKGEVYNLANNVQTRIYRGKNQTTLYECNVHFKEVVIITDPKGERGFALDTNDCIRDAFPKDTLSRVLVEKNGYIIYAFSDNVLSDPVNIAVLQITEVLPQDLFKTGFETITVKVLDKFTLMGPADLKDMGVANKAIDHACSVLNNPMGEYLTNKYSSNPGRRIDFRMFHRDVEDELISYLDNGSKLVINRRSMERNRHDKSLPDNLFLRCFYSKRHFEENVIFVDGYSLVMLEKNELDEYIETSWITKEKASGMLKRYVTLHGQEFFAATNMKGEVRPIYRTSFGFSSFNLNPYEQQFIRDSFQITL